MKTTNVSTSAAHPLCGYSNGTVDILNCIDHIKPQRKELFLHIQSNAIFYNANLRDHLVILFFLMSERPRRAHTHTHTHTDRHTHTHIHTQTYDNLSGSECVKCGDKWMSLFQVASVFTQTSREVPLREEINV